MTRLLVSAAVAAACLWVASPELSSQSASAPPASVARTRSRFLDMFARGYFPGRTGQLMIVPREGDIITRDEPGVRFMHGSPWSYDTHIPMMFAGPAILHGTFAVPARQQDVAPTIAAAIGVTMPATVSGRVLPVVRPKSPRPRAVLLLVLDGMRVDYFTRHATAMPTLSAIRARSAWLSNAHIDSLPSNTGVGHSTLSTGADPRVHGVTGNNLFNHRERVRYDTYQGWNPSDLQALTIADAVQLQSAGAALVIAQGSSTHAATALAGHGACQVNGTRTVLAGYNERTGLFATNEKCFALPEAVRSLDARTLWGADGLWMGHKIDSPIEVRRSGLFPRFEAEAFLRILDSSPIGEDDVPDLLLMNYKSADYVGHKHGPESAELAATLVEMDRHLAPILKLLETKTKGSYMIAISADHGMPTEPPTPDRRHIAAKIVEQMNGRFDAGGSGVVSYYEPENSQLFVDRTRLAARGVTLRDLATFLEELPFVFATFTEDEVRARAATLPR